MATEHNPYRVLGLSPSASQAEITSAYRRLLREHHPDTRTPGDADHLGADEQLHRIIAAYALLRDPELRAAYDRTGTGPKPEPGLGPGPGPRSASRTSSRAERAPIRIEVVILGDPPLRRTGSVSLWVGPVRWHR